MHRNSAGAASDLLGLVVAQPEAAIITEFLVPLGDEPLHVLYQRPILPVAYEFRQWSQTKYLRITTEVVEVRMTRDHIPYLVRVTSDQVEVREQVISR